MKQVTNNQSKAASPSEEAVCDVQEESFQSRLSNQQVCAYLKEHPDFFEQNPDVLTELELSHQQIGAVSLLERQQRALRNEVKELRAERAQLIKNARKNETIFCTYSELYVAIMKCQSLDEVFSLLEETFLQKLGMQELSLRLFSFAQPEQIPAWADKYRFPSEGQSQLIKQRLDKESIYLGRLTKEELVALFQDDGVESVAILSFGDENKGMLAFGSPKANHFNPEMDSLLITQLQALLGYKIDSFLQRGNHAHA